MKNNQNQLKKAKIWNIVLLVIGTIGIIFSLVNLPTALNPDPAIYTEELLGSQATQLYDQVNSLQSKVYALLDFGISLIIVVLLFLAHRKLKEGKLAGKAPYYLYLTWMVLGMIYSFLFLPTVEISGFESMTKLIGGIGIIFQLLLAMPAIMVLIHLFKADSGDSI
ncbi:hypothetical protein IV487_14425 [Enterococcus saccharolyticus]|uniref:hypothetical protein n=1 Tax=Enterococcus saccharolyticus TaxID=41997 RepID=UPI001E60C472|nr:hypothetical protein [Enterococcus saccharolyticus]MCD5003657.1 hypothetical protein [Enterococcus saccharolyticus]